MTPEQFCYWLQGFIEVSKAKEIKAEQLTEIRNHLDTVFKKVTPTVGAPASSLHDLLTGVHPFCSSRARLC
jgi:hypothetical protein